MEPDHPSISAGNFADVLIKAKLIKVYVAPQVPYKPATFGVGSHQDGKPFIVANCDRCHQKFTYEGPNPQFMEAVPLQDDRASHRLT